MGFFQITFYAAAACSLAMAGAYACLSRKQLACWKLLQRSVGTALVMMAANIMVFEYTVHSGCAGAVPAAAVLADLAVAAWIIGKFREDNASSGDAAADPAECTDCAADGPDIIEIDAGQDSGSLDDVEPIKDPSVEDMIFFQRVESLMVNKRLFCKQEISREAVALAVGTNRTYLTRSIKGATGMTFLEYITSLRTSYAATLLTTTDESAGTIGTMAGFRSKSAYFRAFSAAYGCTPSEYRKRTSDDEKTEMD